MKHIVRLGARWEGRKPNVPSALDPKSADPTRQSSPTQSQRNQQNDRFYSLCPVGLCFLLNWIYGKYSDMHNYINKYQPHGLELHRHQIYASQLKYPDTSHYNCHVHMHTNTTIIGSNRQFMLVLRLLHRQGYKSCDCSNSYVYVILSIIG